jgi:AP-4 complex subunit beta-1
MYYLYVITVSRRSQQEIGVLLVVGGTYAASNASASRSRRQAMRHADAMKTKGRNAILLYAKPETRMNESPAASSLTKRSIIARAFKQRRGIIVKAIEVETNLTQFKSPLLVVDSINNGEAARSKVENSPSSLHHREGPAASSPEPLDRTSPQRSPRFRDRISLRLFQVRATFRSSSIEGVTQNGDFDVQDEEYLDISSMKPSYPTNGAYAGGSPPRAAGGPPGPGGVPPPGAPGGAAAQTDSYFTETKKGEVNELRTLLRNFAVEKDLKKKREIIKKVIAYMTLGIDVSRLFSEMMLAIETRDLVIKKMVYLFLCNYASSNPELAQMCTNTFQKDCSNEDPMVRGLALRSLCSLNLHEMVEYISEPLTRALKDQHAYVRKTGVMGVLKLYHLDREVFERCNFLDTLYEMLRDPDAQVVSNCIIVLEEIMSKSEDGGMEINRAIMLHLLNRIHEFSEFGVIALLQLVPRYRPSGDEEMYQIMNLLDPVFRTNNAGAVMAIIRAFLSFANQSSNEDMLRQIVERIKAPMLTLSTGGSPELTYMLLRHIDVLITTSPGVFDDEYRQFYVKYSEPSYNKYLKTQLLAKVASPYNSQDIVAELCEYACDVDKRLSQIAIRSLAKIACGKNGGEGCAEAIVNEMVTFLDVGIGHISAEAASALKDILRKHPPLGVVMAPPLPRALRFIDDPSGKASIIWMLGELGDQISEAPYALEKVINKYDSITDPTIKLALLTSTMKLFFKRPPETQKMLGRLLKAATDDISSQDLHDRALLYHRLLKSDPQTAETVVSGSSAAIDTDNNFSEEIKSEFHEELLKEFNTLAIIYNQTSDVFIDEKFLVQFVLMKEDHDTVGSNNDITNADLKGGDVQGLQDQMQQTHLADTAPAPAPAAVSGMDAMEDLLGFGTPSPTPAPVAPPASLELASDISMTGERYQELWGAQPDTSATTVTLNIITPPAGTAEVEAALAQSKIFTMASGELPTELKFFLYAQEQGGAATTLLMQVVMNKQASSMLLTVKNSGGEGANEKSELLVRTMISALAQYL